MTSPVLRLMQKSVSMDTIDAVTHNGPADSWSYDGMMIGQETTAPGGLAMGLRNIPVLLDVAEAMKKYASPNAWLINLANPSGMLMEALNQRSSIQFAGIQCLQSNTNSIIINIRTFPVKIHV